MMWKRVFLLLVSLLKVLATPLNEADLYKSLIRKDMTTGAAGWYRPNVYPVSLDLSREEDTTKLVFHVKQSEPGYVFNSWSMRNLGETDVVNLENADTNQGMSTTTAQFNVQRDPCQREYLGRDGTFYFVDSGEDSFGSGCEVQVNICHLNESTSTDEVLHSEIEFAQFKVLSGNDPRIITKGSNVTFDIEMIYSSNEMFIISPVFYHRPSDSFVASDYFLSSYNRVERYDTEEGLAHELFEFHQTVEESLDSANTASPVKRVVRLNLNTASNDMSGVVSIFASKDYNDGPVMMDTTLTLSIAVMPDGQTDPLPPGNYIFRDYGGFDCTPHGNGKGGSGRDCIIPCFVTGVGVADLRIFKIDQNGEEITNAVPRSTFRAFYLSSIADLNLGPTQSSMAGKYACEVTSENGETDRIVFDLHVEDMPV